MAQHRKSILGKISALGLLAFLVQSPLGAQSARQLAQNTFPSVVLLVMQDASGQPVSLGSGFFVGDGVIATNLHVVRGASAGQGKLVGQAKTYSIGGVVGVDADADLVLLKVSGADAPSLQLGNTNELAVGDIIYAIGNPEGLEGTFSQGIVSGIRSVGTDKLLQITAPISPGSSGGPVINGRGEVVGVAVATFSEGQNLNFAIPASYLAALLKNMGNPRPLSSDKEVQGDTKPFSRIVGEKSTGGVVGVDFKWTGYGYTESYFSFIFRNQLSSAVRDIRYLVVFFGRDGKHGEKPVDYIEAKTCPNLVVLPNLAKWQDETANLDASKSYNGQCVKLQVNSSVRSMTRRVEIRVLDFKLAD